MGNGILLDEQMLNYDFGNNHVMSTQRIFAAYHLFQELYLENNSDIFQAVDATEFDNKYLQMAHDQDYIDTLKQLSESGEGRALEYGLGTTDCPVWKGMADVSEFVVSSTLTMADRIYKNELDFGFVLLGGLHHATHNKASGFCYYNDINVAIHRLKDLDPNISILYLDTDLHHGDGVQSAFYNDPNVLTISLHESGRYLFPGTDFPDEIGEKEGQGKSINLPFMPYTWDDEYQQKFDHIFPTLVENFSPDYIIWQSGSDAHIKDPLGHLMLTSHTYNHIGTTVRDLAQSVMDHPKVLALGGGGYNPYANAKSWGNAFAGLTNFELPEVISGDWVKICRKQGIDVRQSLHDDKSTAIEDEKQMILDGNTSYLQDMEDELQSFYSF